MAPLSPQSSALRRITLLANKSQKGLGDAMRSQFEVWARTLTEAELLAVAASPTLEAAVNTLLSSGSLQGTMKGEALRTALGKEMDVAGGAFMKSFDGMKFFGGKGPLAFDLKTNTKEWSDAVDKLYQSVVPTAVKPLVETLRQTYHDGLVAGKNPEEFARAARQTIRDGLTTYDNKILGSFRDALASGDPAALSRALRDKRFDSVIRRTHANGEKLSQAKINQYVDAYERKLVKWRSETMARTVAIETANAGQMAAWKQFDDTLGSGAMRLFWYYSRESTGPCPVCLPIPGMNEEGIIVGQLFQTPIGEQSYPPAHPACRCTVVAHVDLRKAKDPKLPPAAKEEFTYKPNVVDAARDYQNSWFMPVNKHLRGIEVLPDDIELKRVNKIIAGLDQGIAEGPALSEKVLYRGFNIEAYGATGSELVGQTIVDDGYLSTATSSRISEHGYLKGPDSTKARWTISVPEGTQGLNIDIARPGTGEDERVLARGSGLRVTSAVWDGKLEAWDIEATYVPPSAVVKVADLTPVFDDRMVRLMQTWADGRSVVENAQYEVGQLRKQLKTLFKAENARIGGTADVLLMTAENADPYIRALSIAGGKQSAIQEMRDALAKLESAIKQLKTLGRDTEREALLKVMGQEKKFEKTLIVDKRRSGPESKVNAQKADDFLRRLLHPEVAEKTITNRLGKATPITVKSENGRAFYHPPEHSIYMDRYDGVRTYVHEMGHGVENYGTGKNASNAFLDSRTRGEPTQRLKDIFPQNGYKADEITKRDQFMSPYMGKIYGDRMTELISMGLEKLYVDPKAFYEADPEYFKWILKLVGKMK